MCSKGFQGDINILLMLKNPVDTFYTHQDGPFDKKSMNYDAAFQSTARIFFGVT